MKVKNQGGLINHKYISSRHQADGNEDPTFSYARDSEPAETLKFAISSLPRRKNGQNLMFQPKPVLHVAIFITFLCIGGINNISAAN